MWCSKSSQPAILLEYVVWQLLLYFEPFFKLKNFFLLTIPVRVLASNSAEVDINLNVFMLKYLFLHISTHTFQIPCFVCLLGRVWFFSTLKAKLCAFFVGSLNVLSDFAINSSCSVTVICDLPPWSYQSLSVFFSDSMFIPVAFCFWRFTIDRGRLAPGSKLDLAPHHWRQRQIGTRYHGNAILVFFTFFMVLYLFKLLFFFFKLIQ